MTKTYTKKTKYNLLRHALLYTSCIIPANVAAQVGQTASFNFDGSGPRTLIIRHPCSKPLNSEHGKPYVSLIKAKLCINAPEYSPCRNAHINAKC